MNVAAVKESYARAIKNVMDRFYEIFLASSPEIAPRFAKTDFAVQKDLLRHGIQLVLMFAEGKQIGQNGLKRIRSSHDKNHLAIEPRLYGLWKSSLLQALSETDPEFTPELKTQWDAVLQHSVDFIVAGYDGDDT